MLYSLLCLFEDVIVLNEELRPRISHLQGGMDLERRYGPGERLGCARKKSNREDPFAVAMKRGTETVDYVPRTIDLVRLYALPAAACVHIL